MKDVYFCVYVVAIAALYIYSLYRLKKSYKKRIELLEDHVRGIGEVIKNMLTREADLYDEEEGIDPYQAIIDSNNYGNEMYKQMRNKGLEE